MPGKIITLLPAALIVALPFGASAEIMDQGKLKLFQNAALTTTQAGEAALRAHPGKLAAIAFGDEDGRGAFQATVMGGDGQPWTIMVDAMTGEVFASAQTWTKEDHEDGALGKHDEKSDGETEDD